MTHRTENLGFVTYLQSNSIYLSFQIQNRWARVHVSLREQIDVVSIVELLGDIIVR